MSLVDGLDLMLRSTSTELFTRACRPPAPGPELTGRALTSAKRWGRLFPLRPITRNGLQRRLTGWCGRSYHDRFHAVLTTSSPIYFL